jgi:hypothetical protein
MRISPLNISRPAADDATTDEVRSADLPGDRGTTRDTRQPTRATSLSQRGLSHWNPRFNQQLSAAQQAMAYLARLESRLQGLKARLSSQLAAGQAAAGSDAQIQSELKEFSDLWQQRQTAGGGLDGELGYAPDASPRQRFTIKGLDRQTLMSGGRENLAFTVSGKGQSPILVTVDPSLSEDELVARFQQAFAPAGIDVAFDSRGNLSFSVAESAWPTVRDTLSAKGGGIRFPSGQLARVKAEATPEAIRPSSWNASDTAATRRTLQEVIDALARVRQVEEKLSRALAEARSQIQSHASSADANWASEFAADFETLAAQPAYEVYAAVAPALASISRERVVSLLALD